MPTAALPPLPPIADLCSMRQQLQGLRMRKAPYFCARGFFRSMFAGLFNIPMRIFGRKQYRFNEAILDFLDQLVTQHVQQLKEVVGELGRRQEEQIRQILGAQREHHDLIQRLADDLEGQHKWLDQVAADLKGQHKWIDQVATDLKGQHKWIDQIATDLKGQNKWIDQISASLKGQDEWTRILQTKMQMMALDLRDGLAEGGSAGRGLPEARIVNLKEYKQKIARMKSGIKANLGCGEKLAEGYINVDYRELPGGDVVADARRLPFEKCSVVEMLSAHLIEHFREHQLKTKILPYWKSLLRAGGMLRIICPNWSAMLKRLNDGKMSLEEFKLITFGAQDYEGDDHFAMYTPETLTSILKECGFSRVEVPATDRLNGICPEMELVAYL